MTIQALDWWIADGILKAETANGVYKVQQSPQQGFICSFDPYTELLTPAPAGFIVDCIQACEAHNALFDENGVNLHRAMEKHRTNFLDAMRKKDEEIKKLKDQLREELERPR